MSFTPVFLPFTVSILCLNINNNFHILTSLKVYLGGIKFKPIVVAPSLEQFYLTKLHLYVTPFCLSFLNMGQPVNTFDTCRLLIWENIRKEVEMRDIEMHVCP